ncbi:MAG: hypothetical protein LC721_09615 [Actinobacteria bacterium]|nr:hypothetical protein [Actinomycetota bacterium]
MRLSVLGRERARPARLPEWPHAWWLAVAPVRFGAFDGPARREHRHPDLPPLQVQFGASSAAAQWMSLSYLLPWSRC